MTDVPPGQALDSTDLPAIAELAGYARWVCWRLRPVKSKDGTPELNKDGTPRMTKVPFSALTHHEAGVRSPAAWTDYQRARLEVVRHRPPYSGVGFVLTDDDPYTGIDLDHCISANGEVAAWALQIVRRLDSYTEITPSGTGLRIFCRGTLPPGGRKRGNVEAYESARYLTVTGRHLAGTPTDIRERTDALAWLHATHLAGVMVEVPRSAGTLDDDALLARMFGSALGDEIRRLYRGDTSPAGGDDSRADWQLVDHLLYWADGDVGRAESLFRRSGLMRDKWDSTRGPQGETYGSLTLSKRHALWLRKHGPARTATIISAPGIDALTAALLSPNGFVSLAELMGKDLPEPNHAVPGVIQRGLSILAGKPKVGKSWLILNVLLAVSAGGMALGRIACAPLDVLYLALEDTERRLQDRVRKILGPEGTIPARFDLRFDCPKLDQGGIDLIGSWLGERGPGALVVIDVWKRVKPTTPKGMNAYDAEYDFGALLKALADKYQAAVVVIHHLNKLKTDDDYVDTISGSLGFAGAADAFMVLSRIARAGAVFKGRGRDIEEFDYALEWAPEVGSWAIVGDADEVQQSHQTQETIRLLTEAGKPVTPTEFAVMAGVLVNAAKQRLWRLARDGTIVSLKDGTYYTNSANFSVPHITGNRVTGGSPTPLADPEHAPSDTPPDPHDSKGYTVTPVMQVTPVTPVTRLHGFSGDVTGDEPVSLLRCSTPGCPRYLTASDRALGRCRRCLEKTPEGDDGPF